MGNLVLSANVWVLRYSWLLSRREGFIFPILTRKLNWKNLFMFMYVKLLNGFQEKLVYKIPEDWSTNDLEGTIIQVPLQKRVELALVQEIFKEFATPVNFNIKQAKSRQAIPNDTFYGEFIQKLSNYYSIDQLYFLKRLRKFLQEKEFTNNIITKHENINVINNIQLTNEQQVIVDTIKPVIAQNIYYPALIHGVTGSGKTEIYKQLIQEAINLNKSVILLLPEVSLAVRFYNLFKKQLPENIKLYSFHSATSIKDKKNLWASLQAKQPLVIIGVHLPMLLPVPNLGLIIIDEEHDIGFQEKKHPKINTKEAALMRAQINKIPIVMGSATPSLASIYNVKNRDWNLFTLKNRFAGAFADIKLVRLLQKESKTKRDNFWITNELEEAITDRLNKKEQVIIFLNRRGYSFFIQCKKCGHIPECSSCSVSLTLHDSNKLLCHYCNFTQKEPSECPDCQATAQNFIKKGIGTQQVVSILQKTFTNARIARADLDSTIDKKKWQKTITDFESGNIDILVGTQTITKGYHFSNVTLVGILWADINLSIPFYNAAETTLQQLIQVAGRAGRERPDSLVIVQTMIDHPIYKYLNEIDYVKFYDHEIVNRQTVEYPPAVRLAEIELKHSDLAIIDSEADKIADNIINYISHNNLKTKLLGPAVPPVQTIKNVHSRKIYLKSNNISDLIKLYRIINKSLYKSSIFFTPNPLN